MGRRSGVAVAVVLALFVSVVLLAQTILRAPDVTGWGNVGAAVHRLEGAGYHVTVLDDWTSASTVNTSTWPGSACMVADAPPIVAGEHVAHALFGVPLPGPKEVTLYVCGSQVSGAAP